ncbi:MAG: TfpX/TfpZ family type IV pilin accessory protein [Woeseiaceae bacterium]
MSRFRASFIHLMISLVLVSGVFAVVFFAWYPSPSFEVVGASSIIGLLIAVDLVIGPMLTLIVYKHGKPGLKFDLAVIALIQIAALAYGGYRLYEERPQYVVFVVDRVEFVSNKGIDTSEIRFAELNEKTTTKLTMVFARRPDDAEGFQRYLDSVLVDGKPDLERRPEYWEPWSAGAGEIREQARSIEDFEGADPLEKKELDAAIEKYSSEHPDLGILPIGSVDANIALLIDRETLDILGLIRVDPWRETQEQAE